MTSRRAAGRCIKEKRWYEPKPPATVAELFADFDPRKHPLDTELVRAWETDGIVTRTVTFRVGTFKGTPARLAAFYAFPKGAKQAAALLNLHGGGQRAALHEAEFYARRGYACLSILGRAGDGRGHQRRPEHRLWGSLTVYVAGSDRRVRAAAPSVGGSGFRTQPWPLLPEVTLETPKGDVKVFEATTLFDPSDYPATLDGMFDLEVSYPPIEPPHELIALNAGVFEAEQARVRERFDAAVEMAEQAFATELQRLTSHLAERLTGLQDGEDKVFRDFCIANFTEFFERFRRLSVRSNPELDALRNHKAAAGGTQLPALVPGRQRHQFQPRP